MKRRRYLLAAVGAATALAGCSGASDTGDGGDGDGGDGGDGTVANGRTATRTTTQDPTTTPTTTEATTETATRRPNTPNPGQVELPIERSELNRGAAKDAIPAIIEPSFAADWSDTSHSLSDEDRVIGVERDGAARAYPLRILDWHEVVNDDFGGPLLVTYCPLCGSGVTAVRRAGGEVTRFGVSGYLWQSDLVMYDEATESLWSQILATAINGELTGEELELVPSSMTTWGAWRRDHPDTEVLLPPPDSGTITASRPRPYGRDAYGGYDESRQVGIGFNEFDDDRLHPKAQVIGVTSGDQSVAYPFEAVSDEGVVNDTVGDLPVVVVAGPQETLHAYVRRVEGETLTFESADEGRIAGGGSEWRITDGQAVSGPHEGTTLEQANDRSQMFWFAWLDFNPETTVYGQDA